MPRHSLYIIIGALCVAFLLMLIILIVGICRISRIEYQGSSHHAYQEFYNCRSIDSELSNAIASIRHARSVIGTEVCNELILLAYSTKFLSLTSWLITSGGQNIVMTANKYHEVFTTKPILSTKYTMYCIYVYDFYPHTSSKIDKWGRIITELKESWIVGTWQTLKAASYCKLGSCKLNGSKEAIA